MKINRQEKLVLFTMNTLQELINKGFLPQEILKENGEVVKCSIDKKGKKILKNLKPEPTQNEIIDTIMAMSDAGFVDKNLLFNCMKDIGDEFFIKN